MEILKLTNEELKQYHYLDKGFESQILYKGDLIIKKYYEINNNILEKIKIFHKLNVFNVTNPKQLLEIDGKIEGYTMDFMKGYFSVRHAKKINIEQKLNLLLKIKDILINLHKNNIIYGDLNPKNVITNGKEVYLCDIVNAMVKNYSFNEISHTMYYYKLQGGLIDERLDIYMLNLLTIYILNDIEYNDILTVVEQTLYNHFNNKSKQEIIGLTDNMECMDIGYQMLNPSTMENKLLIDYINLEKYQSNNVQKK